MYMYTCEMKSYPTSCPCGLIDGKDHLKIQSPIESYSNYQRFLWRLFPTSY